MKLPVKIFSGILLTILSSGVFAAESELLTNGDFEKGSPNGLVLKNASIVNEGGKVLKLEGKDSTAIIKGIKTEPGQRYKLSFQAKAGEKILTNTEFQYFRVYVSWGKNVDQKNGLEWIDTWQGNYQNKELVFIAPKTQFHSGMEITCELNDAGSLYLDNFKLEALPPEKLPDVKISIDKPFCRNIIYSSDPVSEIAGSVSANENVASADLKLFERDSGKVIFEKKFANIKDKFIFSIPVENIEYGKFVLSVVPFAKDGKSLDKVETPIWKLKEGKREIIYKKDLNFYINGKLFYPVILWRSSCIGMAMPEKDVRLAFYNARKNGVNTFLLNPGRTKDVLRLLDIAKEFDCNIIFYIGNTYKIDKESLIRWKHDLLNKIRPEILNHEALFGYFLTDEPMWRGVPLKNLTVSYEFLKEMDPYRPIWINEAPRGTVKDLGEYSAAADIWGCDIYPVPAPNNHSSLDDKGLTSVGKYTQIFRESVAGRKPIWMALQGFSWASLSKQPNKIYPDKAQTDFMALDCIVNGARSVGYWGMTYIDEPSFWDVLFNTTGKLAALSGVITLPDAPGTIACDNPSIRFLTKEKDGNIYIIAVNESDKEVNASFKGLFNKSSVQVVFENREVPCKEGFKDKFAAYGCHIYATAALPGPVVTPFPADEKMDKVPSPFKEYAGGKKNALKYSGKAQWIWFPGKSTLPFSTIALKKEFSLDSLPGKAEMTISADDTYVFYVNGRKAGQDAGDGWEIAEVIDIKQLLQKGNNTIYVEAGDSGTAPCAFIADLSIIDSKGTKSNIISDTSWQVKEIKDFSKQPDFSFKGVSAEKIADYGKGPWAANLLMNVNK